MNKIGVFYGSTTGTTEDLARRIAEKLDVPSAHIYDVSKLTEALVGEYDVLVLGSSTWGAGELQDDWYDGIKVLKKCDLSHKYRTCFMKEGVLQIPASVTPWLRFPLFWLSCHNLPAGLYRWLCRRTLRHDGYFVTYFHPWEFYPLGEHPELKMPFIIRNHSGKGMEKRLNDLICYFKSTGEKFVTYSEFAREKRQNL